MTRVVQRTMTDDANIMTWYVFSTWWRMAQNHVTKIIVSCDFSIYKRSDI